jgi:hypothetical protein
MTKILNNLEANDMQRKKILKNHKKHIEKQIEEDKL